MRHCLCEKELSTSAKACRLIAVIMVSCSASLALLSPQLLTFDLYYSINADDKFMSIETLVEEHGIDLPLISQSVLSLAHQELLRYSLIAFIVVCLFGAAFAGLKNEYLMLILSAVALLSVCLLSIVLISVILPFGHVSGGLE